MPSDRGGTSFFVSGGHIKTNASRCQCVPLLGSEVRSRIIAFQQCLNSRGQFYDGLTYQRTGLVCPLRPHEKNSVAYVFREALRVLLLLCFIKQGPEVL